MMKKQIIIGVLALFLIIIGLTGCFDNNSDDDNGDDGINGENLDSRFFGIWKRNDSEDDYLEFKSDGSVYAEKAGVTIEGTWEVKDNIICIYSSEEDDCEIFIFSNEDITFSIVNEDHTIRYSYNKQ